MNQKPHTQAKQSKEFPFTGRSSAISRQAGLIMSSLSISVLPLMGQWGDENTIWFFSFPQGKRSTPCEGHFSPPFIYHTIKTWGLTLLLGFYDRIHQIELKYFIGYHMKFSQFLNSMHQGHVLCSAEHQPKLWPHCSTTELNLIEENLPVVFVVFI